MIRSRAGRNRSFCRSSRGFDIASPEQSPLDQGITTRLKSESQIARNPSPIPPFLQNRLLAQARLSLCPSDIQILHGQLVSLPEAEALFDRLSDRAACATTPPRRRFSTLDGPGGQARDDAMLKYQHEDDQRQRNDDRR